MVEEHEQLYFWTGDNCTQIVIKGGKSSDFMIAFHFMETGQQNHKTQSATIKAMIYLPKWRFSVQLSPLHIYVFQSVLHSTQSVLQIMMLGLGQFITGYTLPNFWCYSIGFSFTLVRAFERGLYGGYLFCKLITWPQKIVTWKCTESDLITEARQSRTLVLSKHVCNKTISHFQT